MCSFSSPSLRLCTTVRCRSRYRPAPYLDALLLRLTLCSRTPVLHSICLVTSVSLPLCFRDRALESRIPHISKVFRRQLQSLASGPTAYNLTCCVCTQSWSVGRHRYHRWPIDQRSAGTGTDCTAGCDVGTGSKGQVAANTVLNDSSMAELDGCCERCTDCLPPSYTKGSRYAVCGLRVRHGCGLWAESAQGV